MEYNPGGRVRPPESPLQRQQVPVPATYIFVRMLCEGMSYSCFNQSIILEIYP